MGIPSKSEKRQRSSHDSSSEDDSDPEPRHSKTKKKKSRYQEKVERIDDLVDDLKKRHGTLYTNIQYRVWAESLDARNHSSFDSPPTGSFFKANGRKSTSSSSNSTENQATTCLTPQKVAQLRSTYIQQIKELHDSQECGAITKDHFTVQRDKLIEQMSNM